MICRRKPHTFFCFALVTALMSLIWPVVSHAQNPALSGLDRNAVTPQVSHKVRDGDTLYDIAAKYGVTIDTLMKLNKLNSDLIHAGDELKLSSAAESGNQTPGSKTTTAASPAQAAKGIGKYAVMVGDTLWNLALRFGTTPYELKKLNGIVGDLVTPGAIIKVPARTAESQAEPDQTATASSDAQKLPASKEAFVSASSLNLRDAPWGSVSETLPMGEKVRIVGDGGDPSWVKVNHDGQTLYAARQFLTDGTQQGDSPSPSASGAETTTAGGISISSTGRDQLCRVIEYAKGHHSGYSGGNCFNSVWRYLTSSGYGTLRNWGDLPDMQSGEARNFAEFMNASQRNLERAGLQRIDNVSPPITNPHDPRVPAGAVIVVAPGSYGTSHRTAGDIVISAGGGRFINDGPFMDYGTRSSWFGKVLGIYVPK